MTETEWIFLPRYLLIRTSVTKVSSASPALPVISQHPSLGNSNSLGWNPVSPYAAETSAFNGGAGASSLLPLMVRGPRTPLHHGNFILRYPPLGGATRTFPSGHSVVHNFPFP